jgi:hypothetical protein
MKPITVYRLAIDAGLQIELSDSGQSAVVLGPPGMRAKHMPLLKRHARGLLDLLHAADERAAVAIYAARYLPPPRPRSNRTRRKATR